MLGIRDSDHRPSVTNHIAWLSVCVLAAAWGSSLEPVWQPTWKIAGAFGLASALGLSVAERLRATRKQWAAQKAAERRLKRRILTLIREESPDLTRSAQPVPCWSSGPEALLDRQRRGLRVPVKAPRQVVLTPLRTDGTTKVSGIRAWLENVSDTGLGLVHDVFVPAGPARVTLRHHASGMISMMMELRWCERLDNYWYASGLAFKALAKSADLKRDEQLLRAFEASSQTSLESRGPVPAPEAGGPELASGPAS